MNKTRRNNLTVLNEKMCELIEEFTCLKEEEEECKDNVPENLQGTERYEKLEDICDSLEEIVNGLEEISSSICNVLDL